jgi:hypothetical protein
MARVKDGSFSDNPGGNTHLSQQNISDESDWHDAFKERMEYAGWNLKHEEVRNDNNNRIDFLGYHSDLNRSYHDGEWVGFELKYSDSHQNTRASQIVRQIDERYRGGTYLSSGEKVDIWVVAPYVEGSHTGTAQDMLVSRHREIEAADILTTAGYGYLHSWHPIPHIKVSSSYNNTIEPFPKYDPYIDTPDGIPAFPGSFDPWQVCRYAEYELEEEAEYIRLKHSGDGDFSSDFDERHRIRQKYMEVER